MKQAYLEVTFRKGRPFAAYLHLPHAAGARVERTVEVRRGVLVDFDGAGRAIGVELPAPAHVEPEDVLAALVEVEAEPVDLRELAPLRAA